MAVDCHAHVFTKDLPLAGDRRYAPDYDAPVARYLAMLDANALSHGVLVQPSFLGTDNSYMVAALAAAPARLRGIAVVATEADEKELRSLDGKRVVGIRLNLLGRPDPDFQTSEWSRHLGMVAGLGWQVEVQAEARRLPRILPFLIASGCPVVVDHFGKPDPVAGVDDPGFRYLLSIARSRRVWIKISAAYRNGAAGAEIARSAMPLLTQAFGPDRLVWGSDWPHTQFEGRVDPARSRRALDAWLPDDRQRHVVLEETPLQLFRF